MDALRLYIRCGRITTKRWDMCEACQRLKYMLLRYERLFLGNNNAGEQGFYRVCPWIWTQQAVIISAISTTRLHSLRRLSRIITHYATSGYYHCGSITHPARFWYFCCQVPVPAPFGRKGHDCHEYCCGVLYHQGELMSIAFSGLEGIRDQENRNIVDIETAP